ncbi:hypothetical protein ZWY2020_008294 [Hordeum vulgare]|nr:hypothetical protein ZWY2020_008294 [Hordeum vulgare]
MQQIDASSFRGACSLRRPRHNGGGDENLMVASALRGSTDLFYAVPGGVRLLRLGGKVPPQCRGNDSLADGPAEGTKGSSSAEARARRPWGGRENCGVGGTDGRGRTLGAMAGKASGLATARWEAR